MAVRNPADIRNVALAGVAGGGKTTLAERLLFATGAINRMGSVEKGDTVSDWTAEEKEHHHSLRPSVVHLDHEGHLVNIVDTPGLADFLGHAIAAFPAVETVCIVVDAGRGLETTTRRLMAVATERNLPRMILVNKMDEQQADLELLTEQIRSTLGTVCVPIGLPEAGREGVINVFDAHDKSRKPEFSGVEAAHRQIVEQVVEVDEDLMAEYLEKGDADALDKHRVHEAFEKALREGHLVPICYVSAKTGAGVPELLHVFASLLPSPLEGNPRTFLSPDGGETYASPDPAKPTISHIFSIASDPFVGKLGDFKVHQGTLKSKSEINVGDEKKPVRISHVLRPQGKDNAEVDELGPGEIGVIAKIDELEFNSVLHQGHDLDGLRLKPLPLPKPMYGLAVELKNHKDESKFGPAVAKLAAEDPCFMVDRVAATKQTVMRGLGELHLRVVLEKLHHGFGIDVETSPPKVAYKETIASKGDGHHRHKKQTGGAGQFGEVWLRVEPLPADHESGFEFVNATVGGSIPRQFMPAIEKGVRQVLGDGAIAGYPMTSIKVEVYDGKYHPVDSKEVAFVAAGKRAFIDAIRNARPVLLEPFVLLEITAPSSYMGDITGDMSTKRGRVQDTEVIGEDTCVIRAVAPLGEVQNYSNELKSMTGGAGSFVMDYSHDEQTPPHVQQEVVAAFKPHEEED
ncbi:MAG: elongation factor G [Phycisphaerales bacterium]|nr:elongation factor G [Phycisphaerales bacterium]